VKIVPESLAMTDNSSAIRQEIPHVHSNDNSTQLRTQMVVVRHPIASSSDGKTAYASSLTINIKHDVMTENYAVCQKR